MLAALTDLIAAGRLRFPPEVVGELERYEGKENLALTWAKQNSDGVHAPNLNLVAEVLEAVPEVLDPDKEGVEEADPYVLAIGLEVLREGHDARIVTEEFKTTVAKMDLGSAAGYLRLPSVSLRTMLKFERIREF